MGKQLESRTIPPYEPKAGEEYMSPEQLAHFRKILEYQRAELSMEIDPCHAGRIHHFR